MSDANVGTVKGTVELEDRMSSAIDLLEHKIESLDSKFGGLGHHFAEQATSFFTAEAALDAVKEAAHLAAETLKEITIEGSHAADIEDTYEHLTESAGLYGDELLGHMKEALHGTVDDTDLMIRVNQNLAVGLNLSTEQMDTLSKGAFALAKATGGDAKQALDSLSDAMVTGRVRSIQLLTGKIDLQAAADKYALSLGVMADHLSEEGKQHAIQAVILEKVAEANERVGDTTVRLADKIQKIRVDFQNFGEELGMAIATSPVVAAGFDGIHDALAEAFGGSQEDLIRTIAHSVDNVLISVLGFAEGVVDAAAVVAIEWKAANVLFGDLMQIIDGDALAFEYLAKAIANVGAILHLPGATEEVERLDSNIQSLLQTMSERGAALQRDKAAEDEWAVSTGKVKDVIEAVRQKMVEAQKVEGEFTAVVRDNKAAHEGAGEAADKHGASEAKVGMTIAMTKEEVKKYNDAWRELASIGATYEDTLKSLSPEMQAMIRYYLDAGASVDQLAAAFPELTKVEIEAMKKAEEHAKVEAEAADSISKLYTDYYARRSALFGSDTEKAIASAEKDYEIHVEELQKKGVKDVEYYNELWDLRNKNIKLADDERLLSDNNSKASLDKKLSDAREYYQFMLSHMGQYTQADRDAQNRVVENLVNVRNHWGEVGFAVDGVKDSVVVLDHEWVTDADIASATINKTTVMVKTLSGELITLAEAEKRQHDGGSTQVTSQNFSQSLQSVITSGGWNPTGMGSNIDVNKAYEFARKGYSFQEILDIFAKMKSGSSGPIPPPQGPRIPGFRDGGVGDFGDGTLAVLHGKEAIVPLDSDAGRGMTSGGSVTNHFYVNGTAAEVARKISDELMRTLKSSRLFPAA